MGDDVEQPPGAAPTDAGRDPVGSERRRLVLLAGAGVALVMAAVLAVSALPSDGERPAPVLHAWVPYWVLDGARHDLTTKAPALDEVSPFWYVTTGVDQIGLDPNAPAGLADDLLAEARAAGVAVVPSVLDGLPAGGMAAILADPLLRARHVDALVAFAAGLDAAGLDIDYEQFAFADARSTWATTRPSWVAFVTELAGRLHADGRTLTVSIPPVYDDGRSPASGFWVYDYAAITPVVDRIRVMAYDYATSAPGPIAPLDWVARAVEGTAEASGDPAKLVLGLPTYGYNWPVATSGACPEGQAEGRTSVTARSAGDLAARRGGVPAYDEATGGWSFAYALEVTDGTTTCTQQREVHYVDGAGAIERLGLALDAGFAGGSLWALGYEDEGFWDGWDALVGDDGDGASTSTR